MDNLKYSLKTQQFGKKRHQIFEKNQQKQSVSLEVHDPHHNLSHLIQLNKSEQQSSLSETKKSCDIKNCVDQQSKTVKLTKPVPNFNGQNIFHFKQKNICHSITTTSKVKIPHKIQNPQPQPQQQKQNPDNLLRPQLQILKHILLNNEERLHNLADSVNSLYKNTIELYNNHERKLKQLVNSRCYQILRIFKSAYLQIEKKQETVNQIQNKVTILTNTLKDTKQTLRITKIKQECIEALQKQEISLLQKKLVEKEKSMLKINDNVNRQQAKEQKSIQNQENIFKDISKKENDCLKEVERPCKISLNKPGSPIRKTTRQFQFVSCQQMDIESVSSFINSPYISLQLQEQDKKSPFEANQLFQISNTAPLLAQQASNTSKQSEYSFRRVSKQPLLLQTTQQSYSFMNRNTRSFSQVPVCKNNSKLKHILSSIPKNNIQKQIWVDNLNCLRRKNGTYIFDQSGNAVICTNEELQELIFNDQF